nr:hypothetical protein [Tanacetum cinerariifolium]
NLTLTFKEKDIFPAALKMVKLLIKKDLPSAKEYMRARHLTDEDMDLVGELGIALVELLDDRNLIEMKIENEEGAKVMRKRGHYYNQKAIQVTCKVDLEELPLKINLPMVCPPLYWEPKNPKKQPKTLADLKGGYLIGRTANFSDRYGLLSSKNVKNF